MAMPIMEWVDNNQHGRFVEGYHGRTQHRAALAAAETRVAAAALCEDGGRSCTIDCIAAQCRRRAQLHTRRAMMTRS